LIFGTGIRTRVPNFLGTGTGIRTGSRVLKLLATRTGMGIGMGTRPTTQNPEPRTSTRPATRFFFQEPDLELDSRPHFFGNENQNQNCSKFC
jgi:hypothetical protein